MDYWNKDKLGWDSFGNEGSALMALRATLEKPEAAFLIGRHTIYDALREHKERVEGLEAECDRLRENLAS